ncbi:MAG: hypothetical protein ACYDDQ_01280 [Vulcanimicrobiaceae bacterium]
MTYLRLGMYGLYVILGVTIVARLLSAGAHWRLLVSGVVLGLLLVLLGGYRIALFLRHRSGGLPR